MKNQEETKVKITHHLSNGEIRESMKGYPVPVTERTKIAYSIIASFEKKN